MGDYTEFKLDCQLADLPDEMVTVLNYIVDLTPMGDILRLPDHKLFMTERWDMLARGASEYFDTRGSSIHFDPTVNHWKLSIHSSLKNYSGEIELFMDWILPYIRSKGQIGYFRFNSRHAEATPITI